GAMALMMCLSSPVFALRLSESGTKSRTKRTAVRKDSTARVTETQPDRATPAQPTMEQMMDLTARLQKLEELVHQQQQELEHERGVKAADICATSTVQPRLPDQIAGTAAKVTAGKDSPATEVASGTGSDPAPQKVNAGGPASSPAATAPAVQEEGPLSLRIGRASISPVGFADLTAFYRSTNVGSSIGTNFGSIPFSNTPAGRLSETRFSAQKSQIGLRVDADVNGAHVVGYFDTDFFGASPGNVAVPGNTYPNRILVAFVDVRKDKFEVLGGQAWSLLTPGRRGISPFWPDIFISKDADINFQVGLAAARNGQIRFVYHPSDTVALAVSVENPEQYTGGSLGAGTITLPSTLVTPYAGQLNNGTTTLSVPNLHPDIVAKVAFDPKWNGRDFHIEAAGVVRSFALFNPMSNRRFVATGGGALLGLNLEVIKHLHLISHLFYSDGGGRYTYGLAPDLVVRGDGSPSLIHSASTVTGFEAQLTDKSMIFAYYGGVYIQRNVVLDPATLKFVGYGFAGSPSSNNRSIQEWTAGFNRTLWKNPSYGGLQFITQYSYVVRNPWAVAPGQPTSAHSNLVFIDFRYELPGAPPPSH
ncbi:MAG: hypothetical protein ACREAC_28040, partial [Blastocatellia bacterium]